MFLKFVLVAIISIIIGAYYRDLAAARRRLRELPSVVYNSKCCNQVEYLQENGEDKNNKKPIVLISHGLTGGVDQAMFLANTFFPTNCCRFIHVARFGYCHSALPQQDNKKASARLQAQVYKELLEYLNITEEAIFLFGTSAGGPSVMWFAIDYPQMTKGLILHSSAGPIPNMTQFPPNVLFQSNFLYWALSRLIPYDVVLGLLLPRTIRATMTRKEKKQVVDQVFLAGLPITERTKGVLFDNTVSTPSTHLVPLENITSATLILQAEDDPRERATGHALARRIPNNNFIGLSGGHLLLGQDDAVKDAIREFMQSPHTKKDDE